MARQFIYNSIPHQALLYANQLTLRAWNDYINVLRIQTNDSSTYIETLNKWLFSESSIEENFYDEGFVPYIISYLNSLKESKLDESVFTSTIQSIRTELGTKANTTYIEGLLELKANKTYVDTELSKKASTSVVDGVTERVSNLESKDTQHDERLLNLENTKLNSSDFNSYKSITDNAITLKLEKNLSNIGTLESGVGDSYTVVINDGVNSYKVTIAELKEIFGSLDTEQQLNHYKGVYKKLIDVPEGSEGDYCFIEKIENGDSILTMYVWNKTDSIWEETNTSQYITSTVFSNFKQSIETGSTSVGLARDYTPNDGIGRKLTELETNKQDKLTFDETPTEGSINPVTSGGLHKILKDGVGGIIDVESLPYTSWKGTAVPCDGNLVLDDEGNPIGVEGGTIVEKLYFNTNLSPKEVIEELNKVNLTEGNPYGIFVSLTIPVGYIAVIEDNNYAILDIINNGKAIFYSNGTNGGWATDFTSPIDVNGASIKEGMGVTVGTKNDKLSSLFSTTPFVYIEEKINDKCVYRLKEAENPHLEGTLLVSNLETTVNKILFNSSLSNEMMDQVLGSLTYTNFNGLNVNVLFTNATATKVIFAYNYNEGKYSLCYTTNIASGKADVVFYDTSRGWLANEIEINDVGVSNLYGLSIGTNNDTLQQVLSMNDNFTEVADGYKYTYWVYKGKWVQLLTSEDGIKNEEEYIVIEKTGDFISQPESISFNYAEFDTIQSNTKVLVKLTLDESLKAIFYKNAYDGNSSEDHVYLSANIIVNTFHLLLTRDKTTNEITTNIVRTDIMNETRVEGFSVTEQGDGPILMLHVLDKLGENLYYQVYLKTEIEKDSIEIPTSGAVYNALDKKLTKSLSDVTSTTNVATTDNMLINKAGTMYKVTIQELQEVFGSANYKGNFISVSALPATGTAGDYAFVKVVTDGDTDLIMYIWNDVDKHWEETGTSQYVKNATFQATMNTKQDKLDVSLDEKGTMNIVIPESVEGAKTIKVNGVELVPVMEDITWENLKTLRDEGKLIPGKSYKIIDYTCTTSQAGTISAHHDFDIIVTADSTNTLSETARASLKEGDTYYRTTGDGTWTLMPVGYQFVDGRDEEDYKGSGSADIFIEATYAENPHGHNSPVLYKTQYGGYVSGDPDMSLPDYNDPFFYFGTWELDGVVYDRWKKHETNEKAFTWSSDDEGDIYVLTEQLVQGTPDASDPDHFDPSNCTFIEEKIMPTPIIYEVCNLSAWELKYCLDNDITRFAWADTTNGKGVIYYMKDEHGNEAWYDFKSIKQKVDTSTKTVPSTSTWAHTPHYNDYEGDDYFYTFHLEGATDLSVKALITEGYSPIELWHPKNNKINPFRARLGSDGEKQTEVLFLPQVCFYMNDYFISNYGGHFLWENTCITGTNIICAGTMWNVELVGLFQNGLCGHFVNSRINTCVERYFEGDLYNGCDINVLDSVIHYYIVLSGSTINGVLANPQDESWCTYIYTEDFKDPELLIQELYEEEEE